METPEVVAFDDDALRARVDGGDLVGAVSDVIRRFGPEILGLLVALHGDEDEAGDAFSDFTERLWTSLPRFEWRCSVRTWSYVLARRASRDVRRAELRRKRRLVPLSRAPEVDALAARVRTQTMSMLRTETKDELVRLRDELPEHDQLLLVLRVDRHLAWDDLARVFLDDEDPVAVTREAARLRKRFQLVKERLVATAKRKGILLER